MTHMHYGNKGSGGFCRLKLLRSLTFSENQIVRGKSTTVKMVESITKIQPHAPKEPVLSAGGTEKRMHVRRIKGNLHKRDCIIEETS